MKSSTILGWLSVVCSVALFCLEWYSKIVLKNDYEIGYIEIGSPFMVGLTLIMYPHDLLIKQITNFWNAIISLIKKK